MQYRVEITARAENDLSSLYLEINAASSVQAARWFNRLEAAIFNLEYFPLRGARTPENKALRQLLHGRKPYVYRVIYAVDTDTSTVYILHIRASRRDRMKPN